MTELTKPSAARAQRDLRALASKTRAKASASFFKTGPGQYGEGDIFIGVTVPNTRKVAKTCRELSLKDTTLLLTSAIHEERLLALFILRDKYNRGTEQEKERVYRLYVRKIKYVNNWDLVDSSAGYIMGAHLLERDRKLLYDWAEARSLWKRRVSIIATSHFIARNDFGDTLRISEKLLSDREDLIHKAVGWMLREVGKRDEPVLEKFLKRHYESMPRTMLRYAIERIPEQRRKAYLHGTV